MPVPSHHTAVVAHEQPLALVEDAWTTEVLSQLPAELDTRARALKAFQRVRPLRCQRPEVAEAMVRALLIAWVLQENLATALRNALNQDLQCPVSSWRLCQLSLETLRQEVRGQWTRARLRVCLSRLQRFLCASPRRREQQEAHVRDWLGKRDQPEWLAMAA